MNLTDAFFNKRLLSIFKQCCEKGTRERCRRPNSEVLAREREWVGPTRLSVRLPTAGSRRAGAYGIYGTHDREISIPFSHGRRRLRACLSLSLRETHATATCFRSLVAAGGSCPEFRRTAARSRWRSPPGRQRWSRVQSACL